jgi:hypothetical protein
VPYLLSRLWSGGDLIDVFEIQKANAKVRRSRREVNIFKIKERDMF